MTMETPRDQKKDQQLKSLPLDLNQARLPPWRPPSQDLELFKMWQPVGKYRTKSSQKWRFEWGKNLYMDHLSCFIQEKGYVEPENMSISNTRGIETHPFYGISHRDIWDMGHQKLWLSLKKARFSVECRKFS